MTQLGFFACQGFEVDFRSRQVFVSGEEVHLTRTEFDVLAVFIQNPRRALTRQQLVAQVWGSWFGDDHMVSVHISNLRRKLDATDFSNQLVTLHGVGYRWDARCESLSEPPASLAG